MGGVQSREDESVESQLATARAKQRLLTKAFMDQRDDDYARILAHQLEILLKEIVALETEYKNAMSAEGRVRRDEMAMLAARRHKQSAESHARRLKSLGVDPTRVIEEIEKTEGEVRQLREGAATVQRHTMAMAGDRAVEEAVAEVEDEDFKEAQAEELRAVSGVAPVKAVTVDDLMRLRASTLASGGSKSRGGAPVRAATARSAV
jgi:hypothetical protein